MLNANLKTIYMGKLFIVKIPATLNVPVLALAPWAARQHQGAKEGALLVLFLLEGFVNCYHDIWQDILSI